MTRAGQPLETRSRGGVHPAVRKPLLRQRTTRAPGEIGGHSAAILLALRAARHPLTLSEIARDCGLERAQVARKLTPSGALFRNGLVAEDGESLFYAVAFQREGR